MKLLLDTCSSSAQCAATPLLSTEAAALFGDPANDVRLSAVSASEIAVKHRCPVPMAW